MYASIYAGYMKLITRTILVYSILATLSIFYIAGISSFPDYGNYLRIAEGSGFAVSEHDYLFEWLSRLVLGLDGVSATGKVELLAVLNQLVCVCFFVWIGLKTRSDRVYAALFTFCLFGFLFMTSTLRASPAYLSISAFFLRGARLDLPGIGLLFFSMAWHDSAIPVVLTCLVAKGISVGVFRYRINEQCLSRILKCIVICSGVIILSAELLRPWFSSLINMELGVRAAYFEGDGAYSFSKSLFVMFSVFCCFNFVGGTQQTVLSRIFISLISVIVALLHIINGIISVRIVFFIFLIILPLRGFFLFEIEKRQEVRILALMISPVVYCLSILYVFSKAW